MADDLQSQTYTDTDTASYAAYTNQSTTDTSSFDTLTANNLDSYYQSIFDLIRQKVQSSASSWGSANTLDFPTYMQQQVAASIASYAGVIPADLQTSWYSSLASPYLEADDTPTVMPHVISPMSETPVTPGEAYVELKQSGTPGDIAAATAQSGTGEYQPAVVGTALAAEAGVSSSETREAISSDLTVIGDSLTRISREPIDAAQSYDRMHLTLSSGLSAALAKSEVGSEEHKALSSMKEMADNGQYDRLLQKLSESKFSDSGLSEAFSNSLDRLATKMEAEGHPDAKGVRNAVGASKNIDFAATSQATSEGLFPNIGKLGIIGGTLAVVGGLVGQQSSLEALSSGKPESGDKNGFNSQSFLASLVKSDPSLALFGEKAWGNALLRFVRGGKGEASVMASGSSINWLPMGFMPGAKDSSLKKALFGASAALLAPIGFLTGKLPQQMIWAGTGFGKDFSRKGGFKSPLARAGAALMRNPFYKELTKNFLSIRVIGQLPFSLAQRGGGLFSMFQERTVKTEGVRSFGSFASSNGLAQKGMAALFGATAPFVLGGFGRPKGKGGGGGAGNFYKGMLKAFAGMVIVVAIITFIVVYLNYFGAETIGGRINAIQMQGFSTGLFLPYKDDYTPDIIANSERDSFESNWGDGDYTTDGDGNPVDEDGNPIENPDVIDPGDLPTVVPCTDKGNEFEIRVPGMGYNHDLLPDGLQMKKCYLPNKIVLHWTTGGAKTTTKSASNYWISMYNDSLIHPEKYYGIRGYAISCHMGTDYDGGIVQWLHMYDNGIQFEQCVGGPANMGSISNEIVGQYFMMGLQASFGPTERQKESVLKSTCILMKKYNIPLTQVYGHYELRDGKPDPGRPFMAFIRSEISGGYCNRVSVP